MHAPRTTIRLVLPLGREYGKTVGYRRQSIELIARSNARQELLEDDPGNADLSVLPDQSSQQGSGVRLGLRSSPSPEGCGQNRRVEDDQRLLRSFL